jgi:hypothetical protein
MKRSLGSRIDWSMLTQGEVYRVAIPALGTVNARLLNKSSLLFEVTDGYLQSQADKKKRWNVRDTFEAIPGMADFWEIQ